MFKLELQENGTYNLIDKDFNWPVANGSYKEMLRLKSQLDKV